MDTVHSIQSCGWSRKWLIIELIGYLKEVIVHIENVLHIVNILCTVTYNIENVLHIVNMHSYIQH